MNITRFSLRGTLTSGALEVARTGIDSGSERILLPLLPLLSVISILVPMSRGYGIIQRRIVAALSKPDAYTSTHVLCQTIYGDQYFLRPTKTDPNWGKLITPAARHRIAILRAAKKLQASGFPSALYAPTVVAYRAAPSTSIAPTGLNHASVPSFMPTHARP